ncbi:MAG: YicC/YloC family endoribonuclease [Terriglobia bacterium]
MTGYSTSHAENDDFSVSISLKSVNHRYFDLQVRLPSALEFFELQARRLLKERIARGRLELTMSVEHRDGARLRVDRKLLEAYIRTCQDLQKEFAIASEPELVALLRIPGVVTGEMDLGRESSKAVQQTLEKALLEAIERLNEMRSSEGEALMRDFEARLGRLEEFGARVNQLSQEIAPAFRERLERRVRDFARSEAIEPWRVAQEVTLLALRSDITEEVTRFQSHVLQATRLLRQGGELGKKLDFLLQEMNRETNTILSKATDVPDAGEKIAASALEMKTEIEKLREQAQNIE